MRQVHYGFFPDIHAKNKFASIKKDHNKNCARYLSIQEITQYVLVNTNESC